MLMPAASFDPQGRKMRHSVEPAGKSTVVQDLKFSKNNTSACCSCDKETPRGDATQEAKCLIDYCRRKSEFVKSIYKLQNIFGARVLTAGRDDNTSVSLVVSLHDLL